MIEGILIGIAVTAHVVAASVATANFVDAAKEARQEREQEAAVVYTFGDADALTAGGAESVVAAD